MKPITDRTYKERILKVLVHIQQQLDCAMPLEDLARVAHFSPYHFHRIFRGMVGESVKEHVRRLRLERAAHQLKFSTQPVTQIAFNAGYETHESFTRAFGAMFGLPPSDFRQRHRVAAYAKVVSGVHFMPDELPNDFQTFHSEDSKMDVRIEHVEPIRVAFMRHVGPYNQVGETWGKLMAWAGSRGVFGPSMRVIGIVHDDPEVTPSERIRYDACLAVAQHVKPEGEVGVQEIAGGEYAVATHRGPYERLGQTYAHLCGEWAPNSGREFRSAPPFELYRNAPQFTKPDDLLTDIYMPLEVERQAVIGQR
jgi:AraC family transcriptional regulator